MAAAGAPLYVLGNMHDGILILHENSLNLSYLEEHINKNLGTYSKACIGLALKGTVKGETEE